MKRDDSLFTVENLMEISNGSTKQKVNTPRPGEATGMLAQISSIFSLQSPQMKVASALGEYRLTRDFKAPRSSGSLSQKMYLSKGSGTPSARSGEPISIRPVPLTRTKPGPE